jgi:hypothetical protein
MKRDGFSALITTPLVIAFFVLFSSIRFAAAGRDDTFIMLWSGQTFTFKEWFLNYNGAHEEMSSSVLVPWIVSLGYHLAPSTPLLFFKTISLSASVGCLLLIWQQRQIIFHRDFPGYLVPAVIFAVASSPMFQYWTFGGLDAPFQTFLLLFAPVAQARFYLNRSRSNAFVFGLSLALLSLVRTEGFIYLFASLAFYLVVRERRELFKSLAPIALATILTFGLFIVRLVFTGAIWPNPTYAKVGGLFGQFAHGLSYVSGYYEKGGMAAWLQGIAFIYAIGRLCHYTFFRSRFNTLVASDVSTITISLYVVMHETFVIFAGGDWMEYYRFIVPTIPLKVVLLADFARIVLRRFAQWKLFPVEQTLAVGLLGVCVAAGYQQTYSPLLAGFGTNCASPMTDLGVGELNPLSLEKQLAKHNCTQSRDEAAVLPFIRNELGKYVHWAKQIRIATSQAGYFPYYVREVFSTDEVFFIDTLGLATRDVAQINAKKSVDGVENGAELDRILAGKEGTLSDVVLKMKPNMVYLLWITPEIRENFAKLGYSLVWDRPNATIFFKEAPAASTELPLDL